MSIAPHDRVWFALLVAACLSILAALLLPTIDSDDALYAVVAREMLASGDWLNLRPDARLVPRPPLTLWLVALSIRVGGETALALRVWHALLGVALVLAIYRLARVDGSGNGAVLAALVYATTLQAFYHNFFPQQDVPLALFLTLGFTDYLAYRSGRTAGAVLAGIWIALAVLTKGIVAAVVFGSVVAVDLTIAWRRGRVGHWRWSQVGVGTLVFLVIAVPWFAAGVITRGSAFVDTFFLRGDVGVGRFFATRFGPRHAYWQALLSYVPLLAAGFLPWAGWLPATLRSGWRALRNASASLQLCAVWAGLYFLGISVSPADKEIRYLLPCFPPLAVLAGRVLALAMDDRRAARWAGAVSLAVGVAGLAAVWLSRSRFGGKDLLIYGIFLPGGIAMFLTLVASGAAGLWGYRRRAIAVAAAGTLVAYGMIEWSVRSRWEWMYPWRSIAAVVREHQRPGDRLVLAGDIMGETSFVFYYLSPPLDPGLVFPTSRDREAFLRHWAREGGAFGLLEDDYYAQLRGRFPHRVLARMPAGWVLVIKP
ncbi:MAG: glycosyltransferase family 39 protein [Armatimonadota bacterium]|nr:glycosyltransferase family 39 protein [Armatimonadota bacterium]